MFRVSEPRFSLTKPCIKALLFDFASVTTLKIHRKSQFYILVPLSKKHNALTKNFHENGWVSEPSPAHPQVLPSIAEPAASPLRSTKPVASPSPCGWGPFWGRKKWTSWCANQCSEPFSNILRDDDWPFLSRKKLSIKLLFWKVLSHYYYCP